jgi:hypothetical protein
MWGEMAKKVLGGAASAVEMAVGVARHLAWYVSYQVDGRAHDAEPPPRKRD